MKKIYRLIIATIMVLGLVSLTSCSKTENDKKLTIVTTSYPSYDFSRAITKGSKDIKVKMLLKPGAEMHTFEPSPRDIKDIKNSDLFIYNGGDSDEWVEKVLKNIDKNKTKVIKLMDLVDTVEEEVIEGMEEEHEGEGEEKELDEHVWTSPFNAGIITSKLKNEIIKLDVNNKELYKKNTNSFLDELNKIDKEITDIVKTSKRKEIIFGDRFPLRYFVDRYNLKYFAAFPGCSEQTEASAKTISFLINKVKEDKIPVIFHIELSNGKLASTIAKETGAKVLEFKTAHNISQKDFDAGVTYVDIMKDNIKVLREALN